MKALTGFLLLLLSPWVFGATPGGWIVGEDYVAHTDLKTSLEVTEGTRPNGWALDGRSCRLWVSAEGGLLASFDKTRGTEISRQGAERILSEVDAGIFFTRALDGKTLEQRNGAGAVVNRWTRPWVEAALRIVRRGKDAWVLALDGKKLWIGHLDARWNETKQTIVSENFDLWGEKRIFLDSDSVWVGFTRTTLSHLYSPAVRRFDFSGTPLFEYVGHYRGLFWDGCLEGGGMLFSRDLPSDSGYTVPLHSFLETLQPDGHVKAEYGAETNYFIDSMGCRTDRVLMIQRSIFGSDGSYLVDWKRGTPGIGERLAKLPGKGLKLYTCDP